MVQLWCWEKFGTGICIIITNLLMLIITLKGPVCPERTALTSPNQYVHIKGNDGTSWGSDAEHWCRGVLWEMTESSFFPLLCPPVRVLPLSPLTCMFLCVLGWVWLNNNRLDFFVSSWSYRTCSLALLPLMKQDPYSSLLLYWLALAADMKRDYSCWKELTIIERNVKKTRKTQNH